MLSVVTYNILHGKKLEGVLEWLLSSDFDLVCLQEFPKDKTKDFIEKVRKKIPYDYKFAVGFIRGSHQFGELTLFNREKIKLFKEEVILLGSPIVERRLRKDPSDRSSLATLFEYKAKKFLLVNAHLACLSLNGFRMKQVSKVLDRIGDISTKNTPTIFLGDFNYSSLSRRKKLIQYMQLHGFLNSYKKHTHRLFYLPHQLDYVFYKNCYIDRVEVLKLPFSDHSCIKFSLSFEPKTKKKVAIFDFDGTIANTIPGDRAIMELFNKFTTDFGIDRKVTEADIQDYRGKSLREIVKSLHIRFFRLPFIIRNVQKFLTPDLMKAEPIAGIPEAIKQLRKAGYTLGIITSNKRIMVENFLRRHKIEGFDFIHTGSSLFGKHRIVNKFLKKHGFSPEEAIYIGDEIRDIEATKKAEIPVISVTWGFNSKTGLQRYLPHFLAEKPEEIVKILT